MVTETYPCTLTFQVSVQDPVYRSVDVEARIYLKQGRSLATVRDRVRANLEAMFRLTEPDGTPNPLVDFGFNIKGAAGNPAGEIAWSDVFDTAVFTGFRPARPVGRRFDLWTMLPVWNRREDATGELWCFIACPQEVADLMLAEVDGLPNIFDLERATEDFLDLILRDPGNPFPFDLDELAKRRLASVLVEMSRKKGTAVGLENAIRFFLGIDITAVTPFSGTTLVLGESELGVDWELEPSDRFARYAFNVEVDVPLSDTERRQLRAIVEYLKPDHTHFVDLIELGPPPSYDHWEMGMSELGWNTDLHSSTYIYLKHDKETHLPAGSDRG